MSTTESPTRGRVGTRPPDNAEPIGEPATGLRAWASRWRLALRIARRDARRHRARTALIVAMLALPALAAAFALVVTASNVPTPTTAVARQLGSAAQARVYPGYDGDSCVLTQTADPSEYDCVRLDASGEPRPGGASTNDASDETTAAAGANPAHLSDAQLAQAAGTLDTPVLVTSQVVNVYAGDRAQTSISMLQGDFTRLTGLTNTVAGRLPTAPGEAYLSPDAASRLRASIGTNLTVRSSDGTAAAATLVGIGDILDTNTYACAIVGPGTIADDTTTSSSRATYFVGPEPIGWDAVERLNKLGYLAFSRQVVLDPPAAAPKPGTIAPEAISTQTVTIVGGFVAIGLLEILLIIGPAFAVGARRQRRTLALLSATGGTPADVGRTVRATGILFGTAAGALGVVLGTIAAVATVAPNIEIGSFPNLVVPWGYLALVVPITALLGTAAAWVPGRAIARMDAVAALREGPDAASRRRGLPWPGIVAGIVGLVGVVAGGASAQPAIAMAGAVVLLVSVVLLAGTMVRLAVRLAPRVGVATRIALRDADRHRSRTAPALAAVIACVAGGTVMLGYVTASDRAQLSTSFPLVADGLITLARNTESLGDQSKAMDARLAAIGAIAPSASVDKALVVDGGADRVAVVSPVCPGDDSGSRGSPSDTSSMPLMGGCGGGTVASYFSSPWADRRGMTPAVIVDDGSMVGDNGLEGAAQAAAALRAGTVLTNDAAAIDHDGTISVTASLWDASTYQFVGGDTKPLASKTIKVPAHLVPWKLGDYELVLPPNVATELNVATFLAGYLVVPKDPLTSDQIARLDALGQDPDTGPQVDVAASEKPTPQFALLLLAGIALLIAAAATWIAVGLAAADSRADMSSLAAVGASPGMRRRFAGAQAAVIALLGAVIGTAIGLVVAWVVVAIQARDPNQSDALWQLSVPALPQLALTLGVPLLAVAGATLATRSRLPTLTRRLT